VPKLLRELDEILKVN
jgi:hypothetical protein